MKPCFLSMYRLNRFGGILFMKVIVEPAASCRRRRAAPRPSRDRTQFVPLSLRGCEGFRWIRALPRARERRSLRATRRQTRRGEGFVADGHAAARGRRSFCGTRHREPPYTSSFYVVVRRDRPLPTRTDLLREVVDPVVELLRPLAPQLAPADHEDVLLRHVLLVPAQRHRRTDIIIIVIAIITMIAIIIVIIRCR